MTAPARVALSGGGDNAELAPFGVGMEHVDELMVTIARELLSAGISLAFGGTLQPPDPAAPRTDGPNLTESLVEVARGWYRQERAPGPTASGSTAPEATWPLHGYLAWPNASALTRARQASLVGIASFEEVLPPGEDKARLDALSPTQDRLERALHYGRALTAMREKSTAETAVRVVMAGKVAGWAGALPGIAEELRCSFEAKKPVILLGGWGGAARLASDWFDRGGEPPGEFLLPPRGRARGNDDHRRLLELPAFASRLRAESDRLHACFAQAQARYAAQGPDGGIDRRLWDHLRTTTSTREAAQGVVEAVRQAVAAGA